MMKRLDELDFGDFINLLRCANCCLVDLCFFAFIYIVHV